MEIVNVIIENNIVVTYEDSDGTYETYRYNFFGHPITDDIFDVMDAPILPDWVLNLSESHKDNSNVIITQVSKFTEDDFKKLIKMGRNRNPLFKAVIQTEEHIGHLFNYMEDFVGN